MERAAIASGWKIHTPDWSTLPGGKRARFTKIPLLCGRQAGDQLTLTFQGKAIGAYLLAGPDAGVLEARIDDGEFRPINHYHRFSKGLHYPRTVMFATDLPAGEHTLTLRISEQTKSKGRAARIIKFVAN